MPVERPCPADERRSRPLWLRTESGADIAKNRRPTQRRWVVLSFGFPPFNGWPLNWAVQACHAGQDTEGWAETALQKVMAQRPQSILAFALPILRLSFDSATATASLICDGDDRNVALSLIARSIGSGAGAPIQAIGGSSRRSAASSMPQNSRSSRTNRTLELWERAADRHPAGRGRRRVDLSRGHRREGQALERQRHGTAIAVLTYSRSAAPKGDNEIKVGWSFAS